MSVQTSNTCAGGIDLPGMIGQITSALRERAEKRGLCLLVSYTNNIPQTIDADALRVRRMLSAVLESAIDFAAARSIELRIGCEVVRGRRLVRFEIVDPAVDAGAFTITLDAGAEVPMLMIDDTKPAMRRPVLRSRFADDAQMTEVLEMYVSSLSRQARQLETLLEDHRSSELRRLVHQLKGSGGGYGFMSITSAAAEAERLLDSAAPLEDIAARVNQLIDIIKSVEGFNADAVVEAV